MLIQSAAEDGKRAYYVLTLRPGADLAQLLPNVSPLQRELDVVLLHEGILEPALGITPQAVTSEKNLTYEREVAEARCIALRTLRAERQRGDGPPWIKISRSIYYPEAGFREWLKSIERRSVRRKVA